ncbi:MAG: alpha/beta fold hydrolase [Anaerolineaceae bacterium]|nr:alpha/beta fold hydrolase [Anaerolineaceae bacterium]
MKKRLLYWAKLLGFGLVAFLILAYVAYFAATIWYWTQPAPSHPEFPPDKNMDYRDVTIPSTNEVVLSGWYVPPQNGTVVILLHGYDNNRLAMLNHAEFLVQSGYGVLLYDLRGHGESSSRFRSGGWADVDDVAAAVKFLAAEEGDRLDHLAILGFSTGGQVALRAAAQIEQIEAVVADGPGIVNNQDAPEAANAYEVALRVGNVIVNKATEWRTGVVEPTAVVELVGDIAPKPVLFIVAGGEQGPEYRIASAYYQAANEPKAMWWIPEAHHGKGLFARPDEYPEKVLHFLNEAFLQ